MRYCGAAEEQVQVILHPVESQVLLQVSKLRAGSGAANTSQAQGFY